MRTRRKRLTRVRDPSPRPALRSFTHSKMMTVSRVRNPRSFSILSWLTCCVAVGSFASWTTKLSSNFDQDYAWAIISSNRWPGAHAYAIGKEFENIYIGWGHKYSADPYSPPQPPAPEPEYPNGTDIAEAPEPTREEEIAYETALREAAENNEAGEDNEEDDE